MRHNDQYRDFPQPRVVCRHNRLYIDCEQPHPTIDKNVTTREWHIPKDLEKDLDRHTYDIIIYKLREAGWDEPEIVAKFNNPVSWIEAELSHRVE